MITVNFACRLPNVVKDWMEKHQLQRHLAAFNHMRQECFRSYLLDVGDRCRVGYVLS